MESPHQGMFPPATANHQNLHRFLIYFPCSPRSGTIRTSPATVRGTSNAFDDLPTLTE
jgi:hypothetical protein